MNVFALLSGLILQLIIVGYSWADEALYNQHCGACHTLNAGEPQRQGPSLQSLIGRKAGSVENFPYSNGVKSLDFEWDATHLDAWIANPQDVASDSYMMYQQPDKEIRNTIIQFLQSQ